MSDRGWLYAHSADGAARYVLGTVGENPLVCFGINPSTAKPEALDNTVKRVRDFAANNNHDSWIMLNVYPQIATNPNNLDLMERAGLRQANEKHIAALLTDRPATLLAAWGNLIDKRDYLTPLLKNLVNVVSGADHQWHSLGGPTVKGHPRHPLYVRADAPLQPFDIRSYIQRL